MLLRSIGGRSPSLSSVTPPGGTSPANANRGAVPPPQRSSPLPPGLLGPPMAAATAAAPRRPPQDAGEIRRNFVVSLTESCPEEVKELAECPVCFAQCLVSPLRLLPCSHTLCLDCCGRVGGTCPLCRGPFEPAAAQPVDAAPLRPYLAAQCRHCRKDVPIDQLHGFRHFCSQRREAHQRQRAATALAHSHNHKSGGGRASFTVTPATAALGYAESPVLSVSSVEELQELEELGHDLASTDSNGRTALHVAYHLHRRDLIDHLEARGLTPFQPCGLGLTCFDYALYGTKSEETLTFVTDALSRFPEAKFHPLSYELAAQRGNTITLRYLCRRLAESSEPRGPLLRRMFRSAMTGTAPLQSINVLRDFYSGIEAVVLRAAIIHGAVSVFADVLDTALQASQTSSSSSPPLAAAGTTAATTSTPYWREAVDLCFACTETTTATHRVFTHEIFDLKEVRGYVDAKFWRVPFPAHNAAIDQQKVVEWLRSADLASFRIVVEQRRIVSFPTDSLDVSVFMLACQARNSAVVEHLLDLHGSFIINEHCVHWNTPLHYACVGPPDAMELSPSDGSDAFMTIRLLLDRTADRRRLLFARNCLEETPIHVADPLAAAVLDVLEPGLSFNSLGPDGRNALHAAAALNDGFCLRHLLENCSDRDRFDVDAPCSQGYHALHYAAFAGNADGARLLLLRRARLTDANGQTALHHAAAGGNLGTCRLLLQPGTSWADELSVTTPDADGHTALDLAATPELRTELERLEAALRQCGDSPPDPTGDDDLSS